MVLSYAKYIELLSALDEYSKSTLSKKELQKAIFDRFMDKHGSFVAENMKGSMRYFSVLHQRGKRNKKELKIFINFMNTQ